ncbi:hypothetical protein RRF57_004050 [Xylaria bambusicola]|uniref:O-methyltransferase n=1 Tax=Xylaria bambusicola TaxID=326684 RepID=A0AAN7U9J4_9PEZI
MIVNETHELETYSLSKSTGLSELLKSHWNWTRDNFQDADRSSSIITIEYDSTLAAVARAAFRDRGFDDRIQVIEGKAEDVLENLTGSFDLIFVDLEFSAYKPIVAQILARGLLDEQGIMLVDNVFARGFVLGIQGSQNVAADTLDHWTEAGKIVQDFNDFLAASSSIRVTIMPFFDGIAEICLNLPA